MNFKFIAATALSFLSCAVISIKVYASDEGDRRLSLTLGARRPSLTIITPPLSPREEQKDQSKKKRGIQKTATSRLPTPEREEASYSDEAFAQALEGEGVTPSGVLDILNTSTLEEESAINLKGDSPERKSVHRRGSLSMPDLPSPPFKSGSPESEEQ